MLPSFANETITVRRPTRVIERGVEVDDWDAAGDISIGGCYVKPTGTNSNRNEARNGETIRATLYAPPGADIRHGDRIVYQGVDYALDGAPMARTSPTGALSHVEAFLIDWEG